MFALSKKQVERIACVQNSIMVTILEQQTYFSEEDIRKKVEERIYFSYYGRYKEKRRQRRQINIEKLIRMSIYTLRQHKLVEYDSKQEKYFLNFPTNATCLKKS